MKAIVLNSFIRWFVYLLIFIVITFFSKNRIPKLYRLITGIASFVVDETERVTSFLAVITWLYVAFDLLSSDKSIFMFILLIIVGYPIISVIVSIAMFVFTMFCSLFLVIIDAGDNYHSKKRNGSEEDYTYEDFYRDFCSDDKKQNQYNSYNSNNYNYNNYNNYQSNNNNKNYNSGSSSTSSSNEFSKALKFYGLTVPFSEKDLKEKRKELMKQFHPDNGGTEEDAKQVNTYYDILRKLVS